MKQLIAGPEFCHSASRRCPFLILGNCDRFGNLESDLGDPKWKRHARCRDKFPNGVIMVLENAKPKRKGHIVFKNEPKNLLGQTKSPNLPVIPDS